MHGTPAVVAGSSTALLTIFGLLGGSPDQIPHVPVKKINHDGSLLGKWISDDLDHGEPLDSECSWFNNTVNIDSSACTLFTISRTAVGIFQSATERAVRCASKAEVECVLSAEIGFALPAVYIADQTSEVGVISVIAPKIVAMADEQYVRVSVPPDSLFEAATTTMNASISVEYMSDTKQMKSAVFKGKQAFCVQLLRRAYEQSCWDQLDE